MTKHQLNAIGLTFLAMIAAACGDAGMAPLDEDFNFEEPPVDELPLQITKSRAQDHTTDQREAEDHRHCQSERRHTLLQELPAVGGLTYSRAHEPSNAICGVARGYHASFAKRALEGRGATPSSAPRAAPRAPVRSAWFRDRPQSP